MAGGEGVSPNMTFSLFGFTSHSDNDNIGKYTGPTESYKDDQF